jgi:RNA polymerase sigma factor (sigma-70 family)
MLDAVRRVKNKREEQPPWENDDDDAQGNPDPVTPQPSPELQAQRRELVSKVRAALAALPDNRRHAVGLYLEGMTNQEIADLMGWSEPKARNLVYRGLEDVRKSLRAEGIEYEID